MWISRTILVLSVVAVAAVAAIPCFAGSCIVGTPTSCVGGVCAAAFYNSDSTSPATWNLVAAVQANCTPTGSGTFAAYGSLAVNGQATGGATAPVCSWTCIGWNNTAPTVIRFDSSDGLPVELMGFSVE